jgi:hypothetical protein
MDNFYLNNACYLLEVCHYMIQPLVELYGGLYDGAKGLVMWYYTTST